LYDKAFELNYFHRNNTRIAVNRKSLVGSVTIIFMSSKILEVFDKNLNTVAALFLEKIRVKISAPLILSLYKISNKTAS
jgi:hypothetical protein